MRSIRVATACIIMSSFSIGEAIADEFPSKPITLIIGFGAGGMTDVSGRLLADRLAAILGQRVLVENRPGGSGLLSWSELLKLPHDGYTIAAYVTDTVFSTSYQGHPYDIKQLSALGGYMFQERVLFSGPGASFDSVDGMIAYAQQNPVTFADGGSFASARVMEAFAKSNKMQLRMAPFKSGAEGSAALMGGHVMTAETGVGSPAWFDSRKAGNIKIMATLSAGGLVKFGLPDVKKLKDFGSDFLVDTSYGLVVPSDIPANRLARLREALKAVVAEPETQEHFKKIDLPLTWTEPEELIKSAEAVSANAAALKTYISQ